MTFEQIKEIRARVAAKLRNINNTENSDDVIELTLEELSAISGGLDSQGTIDMDTITTKCRS